MQLSNEEFAAEIARLKRRLERERATRLHAESIAEKGLRDLYERQQELQLLEKIATAANQNASIEEVLPLAVDQVCAFTGWEVGHSFLTVGSGDELRLRSSGMWHTSDPSLIEEFRNISEAMEFRPGIGLPGRVLAAGKPLWITDVTGDTNFPRHPSALRCGLRGGSAFPVLAGQDVVAVLEFFTGAVREPDEAVLALMLQIGLQLGRVIERQRADDRLRIHTAELGRARDEARTADKAKSAFLANMSHELRTPLNAIIGFSEMIHEELFGAVDARYKSYASDIHRSGVHLKNVLNDILDISKAEVGALDLHEEVVSIEKTIAACKQAVTGLAADASVDLSFDLPATLPLIRSEQRRLKQILMNLMSNAVKFTPSGGEVRISARVDAQAIVLSVTDNGIGMNAEDIAIALEPFRQVDSALNRRYEGTGLGLPLTKALVELHGGRLEIESTPHHGTTVHVYLPADRIVNAHRSELARAPFSASRKLHQK